MQYTILSPFDSRLKALEKEPPNKYAKQQFVTDVMQAMQEQIKVYQARLLVVEARKGAVNINGATMDELVMQKLEAEVRSKVDKVEWQSMVSMVMDMQVKMEHFEQKKQLKDPGLVPDNISLLYQEVKHIWSSFQSHITDQALQHTNAMHIPNNMKHKFNALLWLLKNN